MPALNQLATKAFDGTSTYSDRVHFVHMYVIEPHPLDPDPSPYSGVVWEAQYSTKRQAMSYSQRVTDARDMLPELQGTQMILVDDMTPGALNNPAWCTYGPCPNCAYLIRQDGIIEADQSWVDVDGMERAIDRIVQ